MGVYSGRPVRGYCPMNLQATATLLLLSVALTSRAQSPSRGTAEPDRHDECSVSGMVIKLAGGEPLPGATIDLRAADDRNIRISIATDSGGHFTLKRVTPGPYRLTVAKNAFVSQEYGQRRPGDPGSILTLHPGQDLRDLVFRLLPSAVISGRILDEEGEPLPYVAVNALREVYTQGKRKLVSQAEFQTNDRGEYRLFGLPPGNYFVSASIPEPGFRAVPHPAELQTGYARLYYPGVPDAEKAAALHVKSGEEIPFVEMLMRRLVVYRIRGRVLNQMARFSDRGVNLTLLPRSSKLDRDPNPNQAHVEPDGSFEIPDVLPGPYVLEAYWFDNNGPHFSRLSLAVSNSDLEGVSLFLAPGMNIPGHIAWDGPPAVEAAGRLQVFLGPVEGRALRGASARVGAGDLFVFQDLADGTYRPFVAGQSKDCFIKDVRLGAASVFEDGVTVTRGTTPLTLQITLSSRGARVEGSVVNSDKVPAAGVWVVLVPDANHRGRYDLYKRQTTDQYGHFLFRGVSPGEYKLFSWEEVENGAWEDPDFLRPFESKGETVEVKESEQKRVDVVAIGVAGSENRP